MISLRITLTNEQILRDYNIIFLNDSRPRILKETCIHCPKQK